jgi:hypothetical protein
MNKSKCSSQRINKALMLQRQQQWKQIGDIQINKIKA